MTLHTEGHARLDGQSSSMDSTETVPFRVPTAVMSTNTKGNGHTSVTPRKAGTMASAHDHHIQDPESEEVAIAAAAADKANGKRDRTDGDFTPAKRQRQTPSTPSSSKKLQVRKKKNPGRRSVSKSNAGKPYDKCTSVTQALRKKHFAGIQAIWNCDYSKWPTYSTCPTKTQSGSSSGEANRDALPPLDWGNPLLEEVEKLARSTKNNVTHESLRTALESAVRERVTKSGGREWLVPADVASVLSKFKGKSRAVEPQNTVRSPTLAPLEPRATSAGQQDRSSTNCQDGAKLATSTSSGPADTTPAQVKQEDVFSSINWTAEQCEEMSNSFREYGELRRKLDEKNAQIRLSYQKACQGNARNPIPVN